MEEWVAEIHPGKVSLKLQTQTESMKGSEIERSPMPPQIFLLYNTTLHKE
jgi:hypothetical protein